MRWQAARRELLYLVLAAMDVCSLIPLVLAISQFAGRYPPERAALAFYVVVLIAFYLSRALSSLDLKERVQRDIALIVLIFWILLSLRFTLYRDSPLLSFAWLGEMASHLENRKLWPQDVTIIITTLVFWWRGFELAQRSLNVDSVGYSFRAGVLIMAVAVALVSQWLNWSPTLLVFAYFFFGLLAIALARAEEVGRWREGLPFPFSLGWLLSIVGAAAVVILAAVALIALLTGDNVIQALGLLGPIWELFRRAILFVLPLLFSVLFPILNFLFGRLFSLLGNSEMPTPEFVSAEELFDLQSAEYVEGISPFEPYAGILTLLAVLGAILIVALTFGRIWRARNRLGAVETESAWGERQAGSLADRARDGLRSLVGRLGFLNRLVAAASIRRIYAHMVAAAGQRGYPRTSSDTPFEYLPALFEAWPEMRTQTRAITNAYVRVHYGEVPESEEELQSIRSAWDQIRGE